MTSGERVTPSRAWYWFAGALVAVAVIGVVVGVVVGVVSFLRDVDDLQRVPLPGRTEVVLTEPGEYAIYYEGTGASDGTYPQFGVNVLDADGLPLVLEDFGGSLTYDFSGRSGTGVARFQADEPGRYTVDADWSAGSSGRATLAVGKPLLEWSDLAGAGLLAVAATVLFLAGVLTAVVVALRRHDAVRRSRSAQGAAEPTPTYAAGWFADPSGRHQTRYWDGRAWTEHVTDDGRPGRDPLPGAPAPR